MAYKSLTDNIIFVEGNLEHTHRLGKVEYTKDSFYNQQIKNLNDIKKQLANKAKQMGANAIIDFTYGQKSTSWFRASLLALDDNVNWYANGIAVRIEDSLYTEIVEQISRR